MARGARSSGDASGWGATPCLASTDVRADGERRREARYAEHRGKRAAVDVVAEVSRSGAAIELAVGAVASDEQPVVVHAIRRARDEEAGVLAGHDRNGLLPRVRIVLRDDLDAVDLVHAFAAEGLEREEVSLAELADVIERAHVGHAGVGGDHAVGACASDGEARARHVADAR